MEQVKELHEEMSRLKDENNRLRERKDQLEIQLENFLVGQDESEGRIVHPENNPLSEILKQRAEDADKLKEEVQTYYKIA